MSFRAPLVIAAVLLLSTPLVALTSRTEAAQPPTPFRDISGTMFASDIAWLYQSGVTRGCSTTEYCPEQTVTRGEFAAFLARMKNLPAATRDYFKDDNGSAFEADINRVAAAKLAYGCGNGNFCPSQPITRDQIAALIVRASGIDVKARADYFWDDKDSEHHSAINRMATVGLTQGCGAGRYCPEDSVTRAQMAAFLRRMSTSVPRTPPAPAPEPPPPASAPAPTPPQTGTPPSNPPVAAPPAGVPPSVPPVVGVAGYGAGTKGGTAGQVIAVTNLNDSGAGSLRAAVDASGPRTVVFRVGGTINLGGDLRVDDPFLTIDGSTAPGPVVVRGGMLVVTTHDVIVRQLRFRPGDQVGSPADVDAVSLIGLRGEVYNVVLDHLTMIWGPDIGGLSILGNVHDVTVQYSIMGEGLYHSAHPESGDTDGHSMGTSVFQLDPGVAWPKRITFHHNLFTTSSNRMPVIQGAECVDLVNNVIYNWGFRGLTGNPRGMNVVNNWFRSGPDTTSEFVYQWQPHAGANPNAYANSVYVAGNTADGFAHAVEAPSNVMRGSLACGGLSVAGQTSQAGYDTVISAAGATLPVRDGVDQRIIANVINRSGQLFNGAGYSGPNPYYP